MAPQKEKIFMEKRMKSNDHNRDETVQAWPSIITEYQEYEDKKPILGYSLPNRTIFASQEDEYIYAIG